MYKRYLNIYKILRNLKSQAALEFLTTYAWAFIIILITIAALYSFGVFDFSKFLPQRCLFPSQFECIDFSFAGSEVKIKLLNNLGEKINVNSFQITNDAVNPLTCLTTTPSTISNWQSGVEQDITFSGCSDGVFIVGERTEAKITVVYCAPQTANCGFEHTINGKITAVVNP